MSTQKNINEENITSIKKVPAVIPKFVNQCTNGSSITNPLPVIQSQINKVSWVSPANKSIGRNPNMKISAVDDIHTSSLKPYSRTKAVAKVPVLKITINKRYNKTAAPNNKEYLYPNDKAQNNSSPKPVVLNVVPDKSQNSTTCKNVKVESRNGYIPKASYTRKGDLSRDYSRTQTSAERIRYLYTKAQRDCNVLKMRLKALRERHLREKEEIKRLHIHLGNYCKNVMEECIDEMPDGYSKTNDIPISSEDTEGDEKEEEYEKLLREVRKIREGISQSNTLSSKKDGFKAFLVGTRYLKQKE